MGTLKIGITKSEATQADVAAIWTKLQTFLNGQQKTKLTEFNFTEEL